MFTICEKNLPEGIFHQRIINGFFSTRLPARPLGINVDLFKVSEGDASLVKGVTRRCNCQPATIGIPNKIIPSSHFVPFRMKRGI